MKTTKRWMAVLMSAMMMLLLASPARADWSDSKTVNAIGASSATVTTGSGQKVELGITVEARRNSDGTVEDVKASADAYVKVTLVSDTLAANARHDEESGLMSFLEKARELTESGLDYSTNHDTNLIYQVVQKTQTTSELLEKAGTGLTDLVGEAIRSNIEARKAKLEEQREALTAEIQQLTEAGNTEDAAARQAELDGLEGRLAAMDEEEYASADNYVPVTLFDVSASQGAVDQMGDDGIEITVEVPGISEESDAIAIHFFGELEDPEAAQEALENDFANAILNFDCEVLDLTVGSGTVTFKMTHFSPVMILTRVEVEEDIPVAAEPESTVAPETESAVETAPAQLVTAESTSGSSWLWIVIVVVIVAAGAIYLAGRRKKEDKDSTTKAQK